MADAHRPATGDLGLLARLEAEPWNYDMFHALRLVECLFADKPRLGTSTRVADDPLRLAQDPSLAFAPSTLASFKRGKLGSYRMANWGFGVFGPNGPLPLHLTEFAYDRVHNANDATFVRFLDIFHHRMLSFFYRAWANSQPAAHFDRPGEDRFSLYVGSLLGIGLPSLRGRDAIPDLAKLHLAGHFTRQVRNAEGLAAIVSAFFAVAARVEPFRGDWVELPPEYRCRLGSSPLNGTLGRSAIAGARVWSCQHKFRLVLGPMGIDDHRRLIPGGQSMRRLADMVRNYIGDEYAWEVNLILKRDEVPPLRLGAEGKAQLGWTSWLRSRPPERDAGHLVYDPNAGAA
jgi:type VI secretion system protein ImpH